jgi:lipoprotein-anchoring transpeptidase ErfK/SrfK
VQLIRHIGRLLGRISMMRSVVLLVAIAIFTCGTAQAAQKHEAAANLTQESIENARWAPSARADALNPVVFKAQVLLARAAFSPGEIDGHGGENFNKALQAYQRANKLEPTGKLDKATWDNLAKSSAESITRTYTITADDTKGPFLKRIPRQFEDMAKLDRLGYRSSAELLAEKFHMSEQLLSAVNKGKSLDQAGTEILVANVDEMKLDDVAAGAKARRHGTAASGPKVDRVEIDKSARTVQVIGQDGKVIAFYPASVGSTEKPAPSGKFVVRRVDLNPTYRYNPKYAFRGQHATRPVTVPPGPNNPVGVVWIDLSAESYGIHGTPEPQNISKTESHGCIRLTNWDALALSQLVGRGTPVNFIN